MDEAQVETIRAAEESERAILREIVKTKGGEP